MTSEQVRTETAQAAMAIAKRVVVHARRPKITIVVGTEEQGRASDDVYADKGVVAARNAPSVTTRITHTAHAQPKAEPPRMLRVALHTQWDLALLLPRQIPGLKPGRERWAITTDATQAQTRWRCLRDLDGEQRLRRMGRTEIEENVPTLAPVLCGPLDIGLAIEPTTTLANASAVPDLGEQRKDQIYLAVAGRETAARTPEAHSSREYRR